MANTFSDTLSVIRKLLFDAPAPPPPAAPAPPVVTPPLVDYVLTDGSTISIAQAGAVPAAGDMVMIGGLPAPAGDYTVADGSVITTDATGMITNVVVAVSSAAPAAPAAPAGPSLEDRMKAAEEKLLQLMTPVTQMASAEQFSEVQKENAALKESLTKHTEAFRQLFDLVELMAKIPSAEPKTIPEPRKEKMSATEKNEAKMERIAKMLKDHKASY